MSNRSQEKKLDFLNYSLIFERMTEALHTDKTNEIAEKLNKTDSSVSQWKARNMVPADAIFRTSKISGVSLDWLVFGKGEKFIKKTIASAKSLHKTNGQDEAFIPVYLEEHIEEKLKVLAKEETEAIEDTAARLVIEALIARGIVTDQVEGIELKFFGAYEIKLIEIPLLGTIAAGKPIQVYETSDTVLVAEEFVINGRKTFALRVEGDSMIDQGILDRDLIIVMETSMANIGQTVVALIDGDQATVKKFYRRGNQIVLRPANPQHKDIILPPHRVQIRGVVIGIQRRT